MSGAPRAVLRYVLAAGFITAGTMHFMRAPFYERMIPPPLHAHAAALVYVSGACEMLGGAGMLFTVTRRAAGIGLLALLVAVFPANIYMAARPEMFADVGTPRAFLWRLPLQFLIAAWVWLCTWREQ